MNTIYLDRLKESMIKQQCEHTYIDLCCSYAEMLLGKDLPVIFDINHLNEILKLEELKLDCYHNFSIYTKHKEREISAPSQNLKARQRWILDEILYKIPLHECCHGFVKNHSIKTNAQLHINHEFILCMDIHDFFPSINIEQVQNVFYHIGYTSRVAFELAKICTHDGVLPQGAPTSPYIANIIFSNIDKLIQEVIFSKNITYSRYADDLTFSSCENISFLIPEISQLVKLHGFEINSKKTHLMEDPHRKIVTGLLVTDKVRVPKYYKRIFNQELYYCEKYGVASHLNNCRSNKKINFKEYMYGKAYYIKMIEPEIGENYLVRLDNISW